MCLAALASRGVGSPAGLVRAIRSARGVAGLAAFVVALGAVGMITLALLALGLLAFGLVSAGLISLGLVPRLVALTVPAGILLTVGFPGLAGFALALRFPLTQGFALVLGFAFTVGTLAFASVIAVAVPAPKMAGGWGTGVAFPGGGAAEDMAGWLFPP